jgi:hypothetical protein
LRDLFGNLEKEFPHLKENILSAMGHIDTDRLLDKRFLSLDAPLDVSPSAKSGCVDIARARLNTMD